MGLFADIIVPALPALARLEERGIPLDIACRDAARKAARDARDTAEARVVELVNRAHTTRKHLIEDALEKTEEVARVAENDSVFPGCALHPEFRGLTRRTKCADCAKVFAFRAPVRERLREIRERLRKGRTKLAQVGLVFEVKNNNHWRWLLFDPAGLGLQPVERTKTGIPRVNDKTLERLQKKHPDIELLKLRVEAQKAGVRLRTRLKVEPDAAGRVHFAYSLHRTPARVASGADAEEEDKLRTSPGNAQNIPDLDRRMYIAAPEMWLVAADWSQIEARVFAWLARALEMLRAWQAGLDIHVENAHVLARAIGVELERGKEDETPFPFDPQKKSFRQNGKLTHKLHYGMRERKFSQSYGIPERICRRIIEEYFRDHADLARFQREEYERASKQGWLRDEFGRVLRFWNYGMRDGKWQLLDREEALACRSQNDVAWMCLSLLPKMEALAAKYGGELLTTTHDSFLSQIPKMTTYNYIQEARSLMEQPWPQMGEIAGFGPFWCPVDFAVGENWGDYDVDKNPHGLIEWEEGDADDKEAPR